MVKHSYYLVEETRPGQFFEISEDGGTHIMNSKDLCMIEHLPELIDAGVSSFKIEGRTKSAYYTAVVTNAYRHALDAAKAGEPLDPAWVEETEMLSHRPYTTGFFYGEPGQHYQEGMFLRKADVVAVVEDCAEDGAALLTQRNKFASGDALELLCPGQKPIPFTAGELTDGDGQPITDTHRAMMPFHMRLPLQAPAFSIVRKRRDMTDNP